VDKVITAKDLAKREGVGSVSERIRKLAERHGHTYHPDRPAGKPVRARINRGRWIADCECGGAEYVDPDEPLFFCMSCGNAVTSGRAREVIFPENRKDIEAEVMSRKVTYMGGRDEIEKQLRAEPIGQPRSWTPEEDD